MMRFRSYSPPALSERVTVVNNSRAPQRRLDALGRVGDAVGEVSPWHRYECSANKRDANAVLSAGEEGSLQELRTIFTIREPSVLPDQDCLIEWKGRTYRCVGVLMRGGFNGGRGARYLELHAKIWN